MNRKNYRYTIVLLLLLASSFIVKGQQGNAYPAVEKLALFTDRDLYIAGGKVRFSAFCITNDSLRELSRVLYAEIVSPEGKRMAGSKFPLINKAANGCLNIPKDNITGTFYLRVYTKYMRNLGPASFSYVPIRIVNPFRKDVLAGSDTTIFAKHPKADASGGSGTIVISTDKNEYHPRELVNVSIDAGSISSGEVQRLCIAVVPDLSSPENMLPLPAISPLISKLAYYPENRGLSITGKLVDSASGKVISAARVNLSIIGKGRDFMAIQTDDSGRFFFALPAYTGFRDLFLGTAHTTDSHPKILVDNDFSTLPIKLPSPVFKLTPTERALAYHMAVNERVRELFNTDSLPCTNSVAVPDRAFYGKPSDILTFDQYVQLPSLEEYLNELPSMVKVRNRKGKKYFKVLGDQAEMSIYDPLVLVDWVAVDDPEKILAASPKDIARIEVVNKPYIKGDINYGGIVSIISKEGDFAGIDLPKSGIFVNYGFLNKPCKCAIDKSISPATPDARNTLYWNPKLTLNSAKKARFSFSTPDTPGHYAIVLQGIDLNGKTFVSKAVFVVK